MYIYTPAIYYVLGVISGILIIAIQGIKTRKNDKKPQWNKITSMKYDVDFDFDFETTMSAENITLGVCKAFVQKSKEIGFDVKPGHYTVKGSIDVVFIEREKDGEN